MNEFLLSKIDELLSALEHATREKYDLDWVYYHFDRFLDCMNPNYFPGEKEKYLMDSIELSIAEIKRNIEILETKKGKEET
mgnify:CR=1 FL=1